MTRKHNGSEEVEKEEEMWSAGGGGGLCSTGFPCPEAMTQQVKIDQFTRLYPTETAEYCYSAALIIQKECEYTSKVKAEHDMYQADQNGRLFGGVTTVQPPPSWADLSDKSQPSQNQWSNQQQSQRHQQPQPWITKQEQSSDGDVFSTMGHWGGDPMARQTRPRYQQYGTRAGAHFNQPAAASSSSFAGEDVFNNIGQWTNASIVAKPLIPPPPPPQKVETMQLDLSAPTPPPTFQPYPPTSHSLASPTTSSMTSSDLPETNSWKSLEFLLNQKPSRSPSLTSSGTKSPNDNNYGHWTSNLQ